MLQNNSKLKSLIDKLWQNFWEGGIANPLKAIEQITYLIFMKRLDDLEENSNNQTKSDRRILNLTEHVLAA